MNTLNPSQGKPGSQDADPTPQPQDTDMPPAAEHLAENGPRLSGDSEREERIRRAAYAAAERRGFVQGFELDDWLEAERLIDGETPAANPQRANPVQPAAAGPGGQSESKA